MNLITTRHFLLLHAVESVDAQGTVLPLPARRAATLAAQPPATPLPATDPRAQTFLAARTRHLFDSLASSRPDLATYGHPSRWPALALSVLLAGAAGLGLISSTIGPDQRLQLLSFPLLGLVLWNLVTYAALAVIALRHRPAADDLATTAPPVWLDHLRARFAPRPTAPASHKTEDATLRAIIVRFQHDWWRCSGPVRARQARLALHLAAAALMLGLIGGLYLRGLVLEYRAGWESTFIDAEALADLLRVVFAPAAWLTGIALPDAAALAPLAWSAGPGGNAAPWIHLSAATGALFVIGPRLVLAALAARGLARLRQDLPLGAVAAPALSRLLRAGAGAEESVLVVPLGAPPRSEFSTTLQPLIDDLLGGRARVEIRPPVAYGDEETATAKLEGDSPPVFGWIITLIDLTTTPEREVQGVWLLALARARQTGRLDHTVVLADPHRLTRQLQDAGLSPAEVEARVTGRLRAWQALADSAVVPVLSLNASDLLPRLRELRDASRP